MRIKSLDVLRALAIVYVVLFHLFPSHFPNGFIGVDLFFVLAGFLNSSSLINNYLNSSHPFNFFRSRFLRIYPNLCFVLLLFAPLVVLFDYSPGPDLRTALSSLLMMTNIYLGGQQLDYFGDTLDTNFFTPLWSLSLEVQFYILSFFALLLINKVFKVYRLRFLLLFSSSLAVISFIWQIFLYSSLDPWYYFALHSRLWEFLIGSIAFFLVSLFPKLVTYLHFLRSSNSAALLFLSLTVLAFYPLHIPFIACITLAVLLSFVIIVQSQFFDVSLSGNLTQFFGYLAWISYSLFLVHWPVIVLFKYTLSVSRYTVLPILLLSFVLSHFIQAFVGSVVNIRFKSNKSNFYAYLSLSIGILAALMYFANKLKSYFYLGSPPPVKQNQLLRKDYIGQLTSIKTHSDCRFDLSKGNIPDQAVININPFSDSQCFSTNSNSTLFIATGDSHSGMLASLFETKSLHNHADFFQIYFPSCPVFKPYKKMDSCYSSTNTIQNLLRSASYTYPEIILFISNHHIPTKLDNSYISGFEKILFDYPNLSILFFAPVPIYPSLSPGNLCTPQWFKPFLDLRNCTLDYSTSRSFNTVRRQDFIYSLTQLSNSNPRFLVYDTFDLLCAGDNSTKCYPYLNSPNKVFLYRDDNHLSSDGVSAIKPSFNRLISKYFALN